MLVLALVLQFFFGWSKAASRAATSFEPSTSSFPSRQTASQSGPRLLILTLVNSVIIYALVARKAPLALLYAGLTGNSGAPIAALASIAMVNGILIQIVMTIRGLYGIANEAMVPSLLARVHPGRRTLIYGIVAISIAILALAFIVPLLRLAEFTSLIILAVFTMVNLSLYLLGRRKGAEQHLVSWRYWELAGALISLSLIASDLVG